MKISSLIVAGGCLLAAASSLPARQPAPVLGAQPDVLPAPEYGVDPHAELTADDPFWLPPPKPPLPYGFTWDGYVGAEFEHDLYGYRRLNPPPRKTVSCYGLFVGAADAVHVMFSYPTPNRPPPIHCEKQSGRCVPAKFSFGNRHCSSCTSGGGCPCQMHAAPAVTYSPAPVQMQVAPHFPTPEPSIELEPQPQLIVQPRAVPTSPDVRPLVPPVLIDDGQPAPAFVEPSNPRPPVVVPGPPPPVLTEDPLTELPRNTVPPPSTLPRNRIPARATGR